MPPGNALLGATPSLGGENKSNQFILAQSGKEQHPALLFQTPTMHQLHA